jgi:NADH dehydrogenase
VAGDAADFETPLAKQAYHALDMGELVGENILRQLAGVPLRPFTPDPKPMLLACGPHGTYLVTGERAFSAPGLDSAKDLILQAEMARLDSATGLPGLGRTTRRLTGTLTHRVCEAVRSPVAFAREIRPRYIS